MADFSEKRTVSVTCPFGLPPFLKNEVEELGFTPTVVRDTGLELEASLNDCIKMNYWLRTAHRVHYLLGEKRISNPEQLVEWLTEIPWEEYIDEDGFFSVTSRVDHPTIDNDQYANLLCKDAVVDRMTQRFNNRPDSGSDLTKTVLFLFWNKDIARIFIDTSGESLSRRNYRTENVAAPMQETLAAGIIAGTKWEPGQHFINPMTGGGTLAIEAAMIATNRAPASLRHQFGFMHIKGYDESVYRTIRDEAKAGTKKKIDGRIIATDISPIALNAAQKNAKTAGVDHLIDFKTCDISDTEVPDGDGVVVVNPPYGMRLDADEDLRPLYKKIGDFFKSDCPGKWGYVFTGNNALGKKVGLRTSSRQMYYNATLECRLLEYEMYSGSKS
ncbi:MAG: class I SAM-dependent RNA methyltransferase, partial [Balneolaceae bacterium]